MRKRGDSFGRVSKSQKQRNPVETLFFANELKWTDRILYALQQLLGIDIPDAQRSTVLTKSRTIGESTDEPVPDLTATNTAWTLIGTLKAFAGVFLGYRDRFTEFFNLLTTISGQLGTLITTLNTVSTQLTTLDTKLTATNAKVDDVNTELDGIRARMDNPFTTI